LDAGTLPTKARPKSPPMVGKAQAEEAEVLTAWLMRVKMKTGEVG
jgi:hypothetical protein